MKQNVSFRQMYQQIVNIIPIFMYLVSSAYEAVPFFQLRNFLREVGFLAREPKTGLNYFHF